MNRIFVLSIKILLIFILASFYSYKAYADETDLILKQLQILQEDIKTLEKAVYSEDVKTTLSNTELSGKSSDVLTKHLLKLSELEEQFKILTNNFEEINFKLDKLSSRITKVQTDNQMRFQDLEKSGISKSSGSTTSVAKKLPGSGEAKDLGKALEIGVTVSDAEAAEQIQKTQSVESVGTVVTDGARFVMLVSNAGKAAHFSESQVRSMGRTAQGVRGIKLDKDQQVISLILPEENKTILTLSENGYGKRTVSEVFRKTKRGAKGVIAMSTSERNGQLIGAAQVSNEDQVMLITNKGMLVRTKVSEISLIGRNTQGVTVIKLKEGEKLISLAPIDDTFLDDS